MRQGWITVPLVAALLCAGVVAGTDRAHAATSKSTTTAVSTAKKRVNLRQFTGVVTALDKASITVEKRGKTPRTMTFARAGGMTTTGELVKDARVTVYYRDEDGRPTARRVVVKTADAPVADER